MSEKSMPQTQPKLSPEMLVPRMGEYLVQKGLITAEILQTGAGPSTEGQRAKGNPILLGQALIDLKFIERADA
ncbi:MAG: hypothetical protein M0C28_33470 [Candidatus Moduliflexus flocculans]|nr:hypothetical protein [Candidatus Moduliflexus flocculans]